MKDESYYAYWERKRRADYLFSVEKAAKIGFNGLEDAAFEKPAGDAAESVKFERGMFE